MKTLHTKLTGENLARFLNIQESIRITQRRISLRGSPDIYERAFHEDILPFAGPNKHVDGSLTLSLSSNSGESPNDPYEDGRALEVHRKAELGFGYRDMRAERSDWMLDELTFTTKTEKNKLSRATESSQCKIVRTGAISVVEENNLENREPENRNRGEIDMRLYDKIRPEEEQTIYEEICNRYGKESGRRYLLIRSMSAPEKKIEAWTTTDEQKLSESQIYSEKMMKCPKSESNHAGNIICSEISEEVTKKMQKLVRIVPFCSTERIQVRKRWKDVLARKPNEMGHRMMHMSIKGESGSSIFSSEEKSDHTPCSCGAPHCDCDLIKVKCHVPKIKKTCDMREYEVDEINNYLITCREKLQNKQNQDRRVTVLQQHAVNVANRATRESVYLQAAHDQAENELFTCLMKVMPPQGQEVSDTGFNHVQELANVIAEHKMINEHEWRIWRYSQAKMEQVDNSDELDSLDSDIVESSSTSDDEFSECNVKFSKGLQPSRIPYFKETFALANTLFLKINAKLEKIVSKNHDKRKMQTNKPKTFLLKEKFKLLKNDNRLFSQICKKLHSFDYYSKHLIPFSERKKRKRDRANAMKVELNRKQKRRQLIEGLQLGKRYRRPKRSFLFTEKEKYRGFSLRKQKFLQKTGNVKFTKCNLVGSDLSGRRLTQKVIHNDYRLIRRMFDDQLERNKESLWDSGMKARMEEYLRGFKEQNRSASPEKYEEEGEEDVSDISLDTNQRHPKKDEQKIQTAPPYSWSYCSKSSGNAAETFASMIRSLRSDAKSHAFLRSDSRGNAYQFLGARGTASSFGTSTVLTSSLEPASRLPKTGRLSLDSRTSPLGGPRQVPSSKTPPKGHPYTPGNFSSIGISDTDSSVPQMTHKKRLNPPGKHNANSTTTLPQSIKTNMKNLSQKHPSWKSSKIIR